MISISRSIINMGIKFDDNYNSSYQKQLKKVFRNFNIKYNTNYINNIIKYIYNSELNALTNPLYLNVYADIIPYSTYPSYTDNLNKLINKANKYKKIFNKNINNYDIIDTWSLLANKRPLYIFKDIKEYNFPEKRFIMKKLSLDEFLNKKLSDQYGYLLENYIIYSLNLNNFICPECNNKGCISLCIENDNTLDSFRDAVCSECYKKGIYTIYEIKTRNSNIIKKNITNNSESIIYSGDYISINTFLKINYSVYVILYARDNGDIFIGKIIDKKFRPNERFLYSLQEGINSSCISSNILCNNISFICNIGSANNFLSIDDSNNLTKNAIYNVLNKK